MHFLRRNGFTLVEIMIVVAIIAVVLSIAIPNLFHANTISKRTVCINNLVKITAAVEQWALDNSISNGTALSSQQEDDLFSNYLRGGKPKCPAGGSYIINPVGATPQVQCTDEAEEHKI